MSEIPGTTVEVMHEDLGHPWPKGRSWVLDFRASSEHSQHDAWLKEQEGQDA